MRYESPTIKYGATDGIGGIDDGKETDVIGE